MNTVTKFLQTTLPLLMLVFLASSQLMATTRYVKAGGSGGGTSWADAAGNLQAMINASNNGDEVWVAAGTYTPGINRTDAFVMKNGVAILGGFPNTGNPGIGARNWSANVTILSGEIGSTSTTTDNSYHVVYNSGLNRSAVLNGFTITGGDTSDPFGTGFGAGMYNENSSPSIINCIFTGNRIPFGSGAGMANSSSSPAIINCIFTGNSASVVGGGMGNFINSSPDIINCTFSGNSSGSASGIHNNNSTPNIINCIIWGNNFTGINGSPNVTHSIVQGGYGPCTDCPNGSGNADPLFVSTTNFQLQVCSPAIDAGDDTANTELTDFAGNARKFEAIPSGAMIDMGAYEYQSIVPLTTYYADTDGDTYGANVGQGFCTNPGAGWVLQAGDCDDNNPNVNPDALEVCDGVDNNCINGIDEGNTCCPGGNVLYVNDEASGLNNGTSWTDAFTDLQDALASTCPGVTEIWVAEGIYVPGTNQADEFEMKDGVDIYGGFPGSPGQEGNFGVRDWMTNVSILSGEIGVPGLGDNCTNVVIGATAVLDGFTIRDANADGMSVYFVLPIIANCVFTENGSDGIDGIASMQVRNCAFINNVENGVNTYGDDSIYTNCTFFGNGNYGTAFASGSFPTLVNCTYSGNNAGGLSGFIGVSPIVKNCIFWGDGGSEFLIVGGSADITNSIVQGGCPTGSVAYTCTNLLDIDPLFVDQVNGDLRLQECSPAIDAGDDSVNSEATDLDGNDRTFEAIPGAPTIDMGAYEYQGTTPDPTPICTANLTVQLDVNTTVIVTAEQIGDSSDGCTPLSFLIDGENSLTFDCDDLGPQMVTLQVTDQFMNTATTTCSFTIADNNSYCCVAPVANCENFTAVLVGNSVTITTDDIDNGSTADCGLADFMVFPNTFGCDAVGTPQLVMLTITDINGDSDDCPATITVVDNTPPSITCPAAVTVECNEDTGPGSTGTATGIDNCSTPIITWNDLFASACGNTGVITRIWTATDASDNPSSCNQLITIVDNTPPTIVIPPDETVECGEATAPSATGTAIGTDGCGTVTVTFSDSSVPGCGNTETITRTWTVTDACGNAVDGPQIITVVDTTPPSITCPADATVECGMSTDPAATGMATGSDVCGTVAITFSDSAVPGCGNTETITRTWTATDECGNPTTCVQVITVVDTTLPTITCPADATVECGMSIDPSATGMATGSDVCGTVSITFSDSSVPGCGNTETITRTWTATDECGNPTTCVQIITVVDTTPPVFDQACQVDLTFTTEGGDLCPAAATISLTEGDILAFDDTWTVGGDEVPSLSGCISDICSEEEDQVITVDDITITDDGTCGRNIAVTFIATDLCGNNSAPFVLNYTFLDDTAPVFNENCMVDLTVSLEDTNLCPAEVTISLNEGDEITVNDIFTVGGIAVDNLAGCVFDNCQVAGALILTVDDITVTDNSSCSRTISVTFIADDGCGNFSEPFIYTYTVFDTKGPAVSFNGIPDGGTYVVECNVADPNWDPLIEAADLTITDACSAVDFSTLTVVLTQLYDGPCDNNLLTRWQQVFTVQDACGNEITYTLFTEIVDTTAPVFNFSPENYTVECGEEIGMPNLQAFDACSDVVYDFTEVRTDGDCLNSYTLTRTWTATDGCGNANTEVQVITLEDTTPPVISFSDGYINQYDPGQDVFIECSEYGNISQLIASAAFALDDCSGIAEVDYELVDFGTFDCQEVGYSGHLVSTWTSKDDCGNESVATINWYLVDETAPTFQGLPEDACASLDNLPPVAEVQAIDDCEFATLTFAQSAPIDCEGSQYVERTWTAMDLCGNTATATQRITLSDSSIPVITIDYPGIGLVADGDQLELPIDCNQPVELSVADLEAAIRVEDGCSATTFSIELNLMDEGNCREDGYVARYRVNVTAIDACGNTANLGLMIDFVDTTPPVVTGPATITVNCGEDIPTLIAEDACGDIDITTYVDSAPIMGGCANNPQVIERVWTVSDVCGNTTMFTQVINVIDLSGPVFSGVPADACNNTTLTANVTAFDECSGMSAEVTLSEMMSNEPDCGQVLTRTWTATDVCGNTSTATQQVFFMDNNTPMISFSHPLLVGLQSGDELFLSVGDGFGDPNDPLIFTAGAVSVTDNCTSNIVGMVNVEVTISEDCAADGFLAQYDYKWIATDPCGNSAKVSLTVFYIDGNAPDFFNVPADVTVFCADVPEVANVQASDDFDEEVDVIFTETQTSTPSGVLITRTWTATDDCGNTSEATQEILVANNDLTASFSYGNMIECNSQNNRLGVTVNGGTPPYSYDWQLTSPLEDGYITTDPTRRGILFTMGFITQTFTVIITDANGCELVASVTIVCDFSGEEGLVSSGGNGLDEVSVYPNPATDQIKVKAARFAETQVKVSVYSLLGQVIYQEIYKQWPMEGVLLDTRVYPEGTYVLRLETQSAEPMVREFVVFH